MAAQQLVAGLEGCGGPQPFWALAPLTRLRVRSLAECGLSVVS